VLFLVTHAPGRLLATIRSRCRRLAFPVWPLHAREELVRNRTGVSSAEAARIAGMAGGSPGRALALASGATLEADQLAQAWVSAPAVDRAEALAVADRFRGPEGQDRFETLMDRLSAAVKLRALEEGGQGSGNGGARWAELWSRLSELPDRTAAINLDRGDVLAGALADLQRVKAGGG
jgi:DNA polymerase-3 subunit delta'